METVKQAEKVMKVLAIISGCFCAVGLVGYIFTDKGGGILGVLAGWATFSACMYSQAQRAIKALKQEIADLKSGEADVSTATQDSE